MDLVLKRFLIKKKKQKWLSKGSVKYRTDFMTITKITVIPHHKFPLKAYVSLVFDDCFVIKNVKIIEGKKGLFVQFPNYKRGDQWFDVAHPTNQETRSIMEAVIFQAYEDMIEGL